MHIRKDFLQQHIRKDFLQHWFTSCHQVTRCFSMAVIMGEQSMKSAMDEEAVPSPPSLSLMAG
jgi:hypothetical protein